MDITEYMNSFMVKMKEPNHLIGLLLSRCKHAITNQTNHSGFLHQYFTTDRDDIAEILLKVALNTITIIIWILISSLCDINLVRFLSLYCKNHPITSLYSVFGTIILDSI